MSGKYNGVQFLIKEVNYRAIYVPCMAHSLNPRGFCAASSCTDSTVLFSFVQNIYFFLLASTHRWNALKEVKMDSTRTLLPKRLRETWWSARADALSSLEQNYSSFRLVLINLGSDEQQTGETRREASALVKKLNKFETAFMTIFWNTILIRANETSKLLHSTSMELSVAVALLKLLSAFLVIQRENFGNYYKKTTEAVVAISNAACVQDFEVRRARRPRRVHDDSLQPAVVLTGQERFKVECFYVILDYLVGDLIRRTSAYAEINQRFCLLNPHDDIDTATAAMNTAVSLSDTEYRK